MDKFGVLVTSPIASVKNIGDYIQSLAALQFVPEDAEIEFIEKESISEYSSPNPIKVIMNAWFMWHPENWPPHEDSIDPLLISMHISPLTADALLHSKGRDYLRKFGPVGCRDTGTMEILNKYEVPNYFSGCLTLTLGESYKHDSKSNKVIFVDPYFPPIRHVVENEMIYYPKNILKAFINILKHPKITHKLAKQSFFKGKYIAQSYYNASIFYYAYSKMFSNEVITNAEYITHMVPVSPDFTQQDYMSKAHELLEKYSHAKYIVTSRIHCALPCIGMGTPVIFVLDKVMTANKNIFNTPGRFGGLIDFFRVANYNDKVTSQDSVLKSLDKLTLSSKFENKTSWIPYKDELLQRVKDFLGNKSEQLS